jgi:hypothetical protein
MHLKLKAIKGFEPCSDRKIPKAYHIPIILPLQQLKILNGRKEKQHY